MGLLGAARRRGGAGGGGAAAGWVVLVVSILEITILLVGGAFAHGGGRMELFNVQQSHRGRNLSSFVRTTEGSAVQFFPKNFERRQRILDYRELLFSIIAHNTLKHNILFSTL